MDFPRLQKMRQSRTTTSITRSVALSRKWYPIPIPMISMLLLVLVFVVLGVLIGPMQSAHVLSPVFCEAGKKQGKSDKTYVCKHPGCKYQTKWKTNIDQHERKHTGEKPFKCTDCGQRFTQKWVLRKHVKNEVCKDSEKIQFSRNFECAICHQQFRKISEVEAHLRTHTTKSRDGEYEPYKGEDAYKTWMTSRCKKLRDEYANAFLEEAKLSLLTPKERLRRQMQFNSTMKRAVEDANKHYVRQVKGALGQSINDGINNEEFDEGFDPEFDPIDEKDVNENTKRAGIVTGNDICKLCGMQPIERLGRKKKDVEGQLADLQKDIEKRDKLKEKRDLLKRQIKLADTKPSDNDNKERIFRLKTELKEVKKELRKAQMIVANKKTRIQEKTNPTQKRSQKSSSEEAQSENSLQLGTGNNNRNATPSEHSCSKGSQSENSLQLRAEPSNHNASSSEDSSSEQAQSGQSRQFEAEENNHNASSSEHGNMSVMDDPQEEDKINGTEEVKTRKQIQIQTREQIIVEKEPVDRKTAAPVESGMAMSQAPAQKVEGSDNPFGSPTNSELSKNSEVDHKGDYKPRGFFRYPHDSLLGRYPLGHPVSEDNLGSNNRPEPERDEEMQDEQMRKSGEFDSDQIMGMFKGNLREEGEGQDPEPPRNGRSDSLPPEPVSGKLLPEAKPLLEKSQSESSHSESSQLENSQLGKSHSEKWSQLGESHSEKSHSENSHSKKSQSEKSHSEKSQLQKSQLEKSQSEKSQSGKSQLEKRLRLKRKFRVMEGSGINQDSEQNDKSPERHICKDCNKSFPTKGNLKRHSEIHERPVTVLTPRQEFDKWKKNMGTNLKKSHESLRTYLEGQERSRREQERSRRPCRENQTEKKLRKATLQKFRSKLQMGVMRAANEANEKWLHEMNEELNTKMSNTKTSGSLDHVTRKATDAVTKNDIRKLFDLPHVTSEFAGDRDAKTLVKALNSLHKKLAQSLGGDAQRSLQGDNQNLLTKQKKQNNGDTQNLLKKGNIQLKSDPWASGVLEIITQQFAWGKTWKEYAGPMVEHSNFVNQENKRRRLEAIGDLHGIYGQPLAKNGLLIDNRALDPHTVKKREEKKETKAKKAQDKKFELKTIEAQCWLLQKTKLELAWKFVDWLREPASNDIIIEPPTELVELIAEQKKKDFVNRVYGGYSFANLEEEGDKERDFEKEAREELEELKRKLRPGEEHESVCYSSDSVQEHSGNSRCGEECKVDEEDQASGDDAQEDSGNSYSEEECKVDKENSAFGNETENDEMENGVEGSDEKMNSGGEEENRENEIDSNDRQWSDTERQI